MVYTLNTGSELHSITANANQTYPAANASHKTSQNDKLSLYSTQKNNNVSDIVHENCVCRRREKGAK